MTGPYREPGLPVDHSAMPVSACPRFPCGVCPHKLCPLCAGVWCGERAWCRSCRVTEEALAARYMAPVLSVDRDRQIGMALRTLEALGGRIEALEAISAASKAIGRRIA